MSNDNFKQIIGQIENIEELYIIKERIGRKFQIKISMGRFSFNDASMDLDLIPLMFRAADKIELVLDNNEAKEVLSHLVKYILTELIEKDSLTSKLLALAYINGADQ